MLQFLLYMILLWHKSEATATFTDTSDLYRNLTTDYNKYIRPHLTSNVGTGVTMDFFIVNLKEIDPVLGTVSLTGWFVIKWIDHRFQWNPELFGNLSKIELPQHVIWTPPLIAANPSTTFTTLGQDGLYVIVSNDGRVAWSPGHFLQFVCGIDVTYFPFDVHKCDLEIVSWSYNADELYLNHSLNYVPLTSYTQNSEWDLTKTTVSLTDKESVQLVRFGIYFSRRPMFLFVTFLVPDFVLLFINVTVFLLPQESGERIGFSVTLLLAVVVFLTIAQELLPPASVPRLPSISVKLLYDLMLSGCIVLSVIISSRLYYKSDEESVPQWIKSFVEYSLPKSENKVGTDSQPVDKIREEIPKENLNSQLTWHQVSIFWDKLSLRFYVFAFIVGTFVYIFDTLIGIEKNQDI